MDSLRQQNHSAHMPLAYPAIDSLSRARFRRLQLFQLDLQLFNIALMVTSGPLNAANSSGGLILLVALAACSLRHSVPAG